MANINFKMLHNIITSYYGVEERWRGEVTSTFTNNKLCIIMAKRAELIQWQTFKMLHNIIKLYHGVEERWRGELTSIFTYNNGKTCSVDPMGNMLPNNIIKIHHGVKEEERRKGEVTSTFTLNKLCTIMAKRAVLFH